MEGAEIDLEFTPNSTVDADRVALTQAIRIRDNGAPIQIGDEFQQVLMAHRQTQDGWSIDRQRNSNEAHNDEKPDATNGVPEEQQVHEHGNPIYGANRIADSRGKTLADSTFPEEGNGAPFVRGDKDKRVATLKDRPNLTNPGANSGQLFETTAVCLEGVQVGTYYGSVSWGWSKDAASRFELLPLRVEAFGTPTANFRRAASAWNRSAFHTEYPYAFDPARGRMAFTRIPSSDPKRQNLKLPTGPALPPSTFYARMKKEARATSTPNSGHLSVDDYAGLVTRYNIFVQSVPSEAKRVVDTIIIGLDKMSADNSYWKKGMKAIHFKPFYDSVISVRDAL